MKNVFPWLLVVILAALLLGRVFNETTRTGDALSAEFRTVGEVFSSVEWISMGSAGEVEVWRDKGREMVAVTKGQNALALITSQGSRQTAILFHNGQPSVEQRFRSDERALEVVRYYPAPGNKVWVVDSDGDTVNDIRVNEKMRTKERFHGGEWRPEVKTM